MEKTRISIWAHIGDFMRAVFRDEEPEKQNEENLSDIPASYYEEKNVTKEQMEMLKESDAKLSGKKQEKSEENKEEIRSNFVRRNYNSGNTGGSKGKTVIDSNEVKIAEKPDNERSK